MVGLVIVSHHAGLATGVVELARQMGGEELAIEAAGGMEDGSVGTDAERVKAAIERARSDDGVLVLMDLGSALMSAEMAVELVGMDDEGLEVVLSDAPLVEGAVAAAATARGGASLAEVAGEARGALAMKVSQLGGEEEAGAPPAAEAADDTDTGGPELRLQVTNRLGLHARPAARFVAAAGRFDARVRVQDASNGRGPVDGRSLTGLITLGVRQGHDLVVQASGAEAQAALDALAELAADGFGDEDGGGPAQPAPAREPGPRDDTRPQPPAEPPAAGARLRGVPASSGIAVGPARPLGGAAVASPADDDPAGTPAEERERLASALAAAREDIGEARSAIAERAGEAEAAIFDAQALLLDDSALLEPARRAIDEDGRAAPAAWHAAAQAVAEAYRELEDPYLRERAADVEDVAGRVLAHLAGGPAAEVATAEGIVIADELTPGQAAGLDRERVRGIATARGGATAHAAILARALGIPAVVGLGPGVLAIAAGTPLVLDGEAGTLDVDPGEAALAEAGERRDAARAAGEHARAHAAEAAVTSDGTVVEVAANLGAPEETAGAVALGADGVGLLRTEFLFLDRDDAPGDDEQHEVYARIAAALEGRPLVIRTLDAGADKPLAFLRQAPEDNPFLGRRGIRLALAEPELLDTQLRAVLRTAADHPGAVKLMFPMVATLAELREARAALERARQATGIDAPLEVGVMVEVPAVALAAQRFAAEVDFFSIGTNDLSQYAMAAERGNAAVAELIDGPLPAVLGLVALVTGAAADHGRWVGVCGELAGEPAAAALLVGLGVTELSMAAPRIPEVKALIRALDRGAAHAVAREALELDDAAAVRSLAAERLVRPNG